MKKIYYPDHDKRYAHIPKSLRPLYPDEIRDGWVIIKRTKLAKDLTPEDVRSVGFGTPACILAKDIPYTEALCRC